MIETFIYGKNYSFEVYPTAILGNNFVNLKYLSALDADTAALLNFDPQAMHAKVFPTLPQGSIDDYRKYQYGKFEDSNGQIAIIGFPWIKMDTATEITSTYLMVKVKAGASDVAGVRSALVSNGYQVLEVTAS